MASWRDFFVIKKDNAENNNYKLENNADIYDSIDDDSDLICPIKYE